MNKKIVMVDFDGVIHRAGSGYDKENIYDIPMPGAKYTIRKWMDQGWEVVVFTARPEDQWDKIEAWLKQYHFPPLEVTNVKRPARFYIDNRAIRFTSWPDIAYYIL